tara:strand:- start:151 stop:690 length:540 start_codon:yes stop_codon:yes gene_type:complete
MSTELYSTNITGVNILKSKKFSDKRGFFLNNFRIQDDAFKSSWGERKVSQINLSITKKVGSIRGLHFQEKPYVDAKLVRCLKGKIFDVVVDLRKDSETFLKFYSIELSDQDNNSILIPEGCAHGFQVLEPQSELLYIHSGEWIPESENGIRWNDPKLSIPWPLEPEDISERDKSLPLIS